MQRLKDSKNTVKLKKEEQRGAYSGYLMCLVSRDGNIRKNLVLMDVAEWRDQHLKQRKTVMRHFTDFIAEYYY